MVVEIGYLKALLLAYGFAGRPLSSQLVKIQQGRDVAPGSPALMWCVVLLVAATSVAHRRWTSGKRVTAPECGSVVIIKCDATGAGRCGPWAHYDQSLAPNRAGKTRSCSSSTGS